MAEQLLSGDGFVSELPQTNLAPEPFVKEVPEQLSPSGVPLNISTQNIAETAINNNAKELSDQLRRETASTSEKLEATAASWENTYLATGIDFLKNDVPEIGKEDEVFQKTLTNDFLIGYMAENGIAPKYYQQLRTAKNQNHFNSRVDEVKNDMANEATVDKFLNAYGGMLTERTVATLTTGIAGDIDTLIPIYGLAAKLTKMGKIMATASVVTHVGGSAIAYQKDPDVSAGEALVAATLGSVVDAPIINKIGSNVIPKGIPNDDMLTAIVKDTDKTDHRLTIKEMIAKSKRSHLSAEEVEVSKLLERADELTPRGSPTKRALEAQARLDELGYNQKAKPTTDADIEAFLNKEIDDLKQAQTDEWKANRRKELRAEADADYLEAKKASANQLKIDIKARLNKAKDNSLKTLKQMEKLINKNAPKSVRDELRAKAGWEVRYYRKEAQDIVEDMNGFKIYMKDLGKRLQDSSDTAAVKTRDSIKQRIDKLKDDGYLSQSDYDQASYALNKADGTGFDKVKFYLQDAGDGMMEVVSSTGKTIGKNKKIVIPTAMVVGATTLPAAEFDGISTTGIFGIMLAIGAGGFIAMAAPTFLSKTRKALARGDLKHRVKSTMQNRDELIEDARFGFMERYAALKNEGVAEIDEFADEILWNALDGSAHSVDTLRNVLANSWTQPLLKDMDMSYKLWIKEQDISNLSRMGNMFQLSIGYRQRFENIVHTAIESGDDLGMPSVRQAMDSANNLKAKVLQDMKDAGVVGSANIPNDPTYMPRKIRQDYIGTALRSASDDSVTEFTDMISTMMGGKPEKANAYVQMIKAFGGKKSAITTMVELEEYMAKKGIKGVSAEEIASFVGLDKAMSRSGIEVGDQFGATKFRIDIDKGLWKDMSLYSDTGEEIALTLDSLYVNQVTENLTTYFQRAAGYVAVASKNKSVSELYAVAEKAKSVQIQTMIREIVDDIIGIPNVDEFADASKLMRDLANYNVASTMSMSAISLVQETALTLINLNGTGFKTAIGELKNVFLKHGKSSELVQSFTRGTGIGMHKHTASYGAFNHLGDANLMDGSYRTSEVGKAFSKTGEMMRDFTLYNLGMVPLSDYLSKVAGTSNMETLYKLTRGETKLSDVRLKAYGITQEGLDTMGKYLKKDNNGAIDAIDWDNIPFKDRILLQTTLQQMNQKQVMQTMMGNTGHWTTSSPLGIAASQLLKFPMGAFSNLGLFSAKGMSNGDLRAYGETMSWFATGYLISLARAEMKGQERTEEEHIRNAIFSMSSMGIFNVVNGVSDPAIAGLGERMGQLVNMAKD